VSPDPEPQPDDGGRARRAVAFWLALAAAVAALAVLGFGATLHGSFLADDFNAVYACSRVRALHEALDLDGSFRLRLIREVYPDYQTDTLLVRPLPTLSFWLDWLRSGRDPSGFRSTALVLHVLVALAVAVLARVLTRSRTAAAIAALLFVCHPAHPEAVVWVAARADLLVGLFMALSLACWLRFLEVGRRRWLAGAAGTFVLALASKEMATALPGIALALAAAERAPGRWRRAFAGTAVLAAVLGAYVAFRLVVIGSLRSYHHPEGGLVGAARNAFVFLRGAGLAAVWPGDRLAHPDPDLLRALFALALGAFALLAAARVRAPGRLARAGACLLAAVVSTAPVAVWSAVLPDGQGTRLIYPSLMLLAVAAGALAPRVCPAVVLAVGALLAVSLPLQRRATEPWQRAAATMTAVVDGLVAASEGKRALLLSNDVPRRDGPAYLAQNSLPAALWLWRPGIKVEFAPPAEWQALVEEHRATLEQDPTVAALRFDAAQRRWVDADGR